VAGAYDEAWLLAVLAQQGLTDLKGLSRSGRVWAQGTAQVESRAVQLRVGLPPDFPSSLPQVLLTPWDALGVLPHISALSGTVCYKDSEGLLLDQSRPAELVAWALQQALVELARGVRGENRLDFTEEFEANWHQLPNAASLRNVLDLPTGPSEMRVFWLNDGHAYLADEDRQVAAFLQRDNLGKYTAGRALYLPLPTGSFVEPPRPDRPFWTAAELRHWLAPGLTTMTDAQRRAWLTANASQSGVLVVGLPRPSRGTALFAMSYRSPAGHHPLLPGAEVVLRPMQVQRWEPSYLVPRGGGQLSLRTKRVLLIGCGAIGGIVAHELVRSGVLQLTLVDFDIHQMENTFRSVLGMARQPGPKVDVLAAELRTKYPYLTVRPINGTVQAAYRTGLLNWSDYDLIVAATGNPTAERWLNEQLWAADHHPPALFTWLEAYGIGGHALLTRPGVSGCLECLYTTATGQVMLVNRAAFAAEGQVFSLSLAGCSARHTPYGALDAARTAELATRLAVRFFAGREAGSPLLSWKGDSTDFTEAGFTLADRFAASEERLFTSRYAYRQPACRVCGRPTHAPPVAA
jgi:molybdopterin/thiamine biosynthesis adenylyltransferase